MKAKGKNGQIIYSFSFLIPMLHDDDDDGDDEREKRRRKDDSCSHKSLFRLLLSLLEDLDS